jgi:hypothetical protein
MYFYFGSVGHNMLDLTPYFRNIERTPKKWGNLSGIWKYKDKNRSDMQVVGFEMKKLLHTRKHSTNTAPSGYKNYEMMQHAPTARK